MTKMLLIYLLSLPLLGQYVAYRGSNGKATWAKLGSSITVSPTSPYPTLECAPTASLLSRPPVTFSFSVAAGQTVFSLPASELADPRWVLVSYAVVLVEGEDYTVSANKRTVTFTKTVPTPGGTVQIIAIF